MTLCSCGKQNSAGICEHTRPASPAPQPKELRSVPFAELYPECVEPPVQPAGARELPKSQLAGFRGWNNPDRFIVEIEILLKHLASERARADAAERALSEAAMEINCAGPVANRIRVLKRTHEDHLLKLEAERESLRSELRDMREASPT
jgi:hypothetical protein